MSTDNDDDEMDFDPLADDPDLSGEGSDDERDLDDEYSLNGYYANSVPAYDHRNDDEED